MAEASQLFDMFEKNGVCFCCGRKCKKHIFVYYDTNEKEFKNVTLCEDCYIIWTYIREETREAHELSVEKLRKTCGKFNHSVSSFLIGGDR